MSLLTMTSRAVYYMSELPPQTLVAKRKISHNPPSNIIYNYLHKESEEQARHQSQRDTPHSQDPCNSTHTDIPCTCMPMHQQIDPRQWDHTNALQNATSDKDEYLTSDWVQATKVSTHVPPTQPLPNFEIIQRRCI